MDVDVGTAGSTWEDDLYSRFKQLQRQLEFLEIQVGFPWASLAGAMRAAVPCVYPVCLKPFGNTFRPNSATWTPGLLDLRPGSMTHHRGWLVG